MNVWIFHHTDVPTFFYMAHSFKFRSILFKLLFTPMASYIVIFSWNKKASNNFIKIDIGHGIEIFMYNISFQLYQPILTFYSTFHLSLLIKNCQVLFEILLTSLHLVCFYERKRHSSRIILLVNKRVNICHTKAGLGNKITWFRII